MTTLLQPKRLLLVVLATYFFFGIQHLTRFVTADEHYWMYERIPQYWEAINQGKWQKTFINDKPGVSVALISGIGLFFEPHPDRHFFESPDRILRYDISNTELLLLTFRLPLLIANGLILLFLFWTIGRLTDSWTALWTVLFMALSPILLGISQIINPDTLLWSCVAASLFSYCALLKFGEKKFLALTVVFTGLALLTKYVAFILLPFFLTLIIFRFLATSDQEQASPLVSTLKRDLLLWGIVVIGAGALLSLFLPALLFDPKYASDLLMTIRNKETLGIIGGSLLALLVVDTFALKNTFLLVLRAIGRRIGSTLRIMPFLFLVLFVGLIIARNFFPYWDIFARIPFDIKDLSDARYHTNVPTMSEAFILEWNPLVFSLTPVVLLSLCALFISLARKKYRSDALIPYALLFFLLLYAGLLIFSNVLATPRYSIILYPMFAFLAALGIRQLTITLSRPYAPVIATAIVFIGSYISLVGSKPFYFNYTNVLLPQSALINDAWGYGGYEAAQYLNSLPDAERLTVWIDYYGVCEFFVGQCLNAYTFDQNIVKPDYYVLTRRGKIRYMSRYTRWERLSGLTAYRYYDATDPAWQLLIDDRPGNFIKVVKVRK